MKLRLSNSKSRMVQTDNLRGYDFVLLAEDSVRGALKRRKQYGVAKVFDVEYPVNIGVVIESAGTHSLVKVSDKIEVVPLKNELENIVYVYRQNIATLNMNAMDGQELAMAWFNGQDSFNKIAKASKKSIGAVFSYLLTAGLVTYPNSFSELSMGIFDVFRPEFGWYEVYGKQG